MKSIDKNLKTPLYLQLVNILIEKIEKNKADLVINDSIGKVLSNAVNLIS